MKQLIDNIEIAGLEILSKDVEKLYETSHGVRLLAVEMNLTEARHVKVEKHLLEFKQDDHNWIGLTLSMPEMEPHHYLIPTSTFNDPDNYVFFSHDIEMLPKLSNWEIKVFGNGMARLSEFAFSNQVHKLK